MSGPARPASPGQGARSRRVAGNAGNAGIALGLISGLEALAQHRLLERLIRGRTWIGIVAFALIGIVTLQLGLLKLNGGIGRALEHEAALQRQNAALSIENSELAAGSRVEASAAQLGMAFVPVSSLRFLPSSSHGDIDKAAAALSAAARSSSVEGGETTTSGGESGESAAGTESQPSPEGETATASSSQSTSQAPATSGQSGESASGESAAGEAPTSAESGAPASSESTSSESTAASAPAVTSAGGGIQAAPGE
ncbi:MAG TPA: hypothetical protein VK605_09340 [Solirubrobacteraceae bacterium]|nr:hypothetical protein [Solirubrobacteraceae bacterium]